MYIFFAFFLYAYSKELSDNIYIYYQYNEF